MENIENTEKVENEKETGAGSVANTISGEERHHHHHHHHHHRHKEETPAERRSRKLRHFRKKLGKFFARNRQVFITLCITLSILGLLFIGVMAYGLLDKPAPMSENDYKVNIVQDDNTFTVFSSSTATVYVYYGTYNNVEELEGVRTLGTVTPIHPFVAKYNGPYTLYVDYVKAEYEDEFHPYEIEGNLEPIALAEKDGKIVWEVKMGYEINEISYTLGQTLGFQYGQDYKALPIDNFTVAPLGSGMHTFMVKATDNDGEQNTYFMAIDVKGYNE